MCDSPAELVSDVWDSVEDYGGDILDSTMPLALDFVTFGNGDAAWYSLSGSKDRAERDLGRRNEELNSMNDQLKSLQDKLGNKVFLEQIFKYGDIRRIKDLGTKYEQLVKEYESLLNDYNSNQDGNFLASFYLFIPNVMAAYTYNMLDFMKTGDSKSLRTAMTIGLLIAAIVVSVLALIPSGGSSSVTLSTAIAATLTIISAVLTLDAMVNNSGLLGSVFQMLDLVLNKILHVDSFLHTEGFDKDSEYYQSMMNNTRLAIQIAAAIANVYNLFTSPPSPDMSTAAGRMAARNADFNSYAGGVASGQTITMQTSAGISGTSSSAFIAKLQDIGSYKIADTVSLSDIYNAYTQAEQANDIYGALTLRAELGRKLEDAKDAMQKKINKDNRRKMEGSYSDAAYIANQVDMSYHSYVLQMSEAGQTDVFDPQGTIVMNTRYHPVKSYMFGFEDMFQYDGMAGGQMYVYNTLWK